jgi:mannose-6-phosphate isomerase-like protein (cupin superfamily)
MSSHLQKVVRAAGVGVAAFGVGVLVAQAPVVTFRPATEVKAALADKAKATPAAEMISAPVSAGDHYQINVVHRNKPQGAIAHQVGSEIHSIIDGSGTLVTGGTIVRPTGAGDRAPGRIEGGVRRRIQKGDIVLVPPQTPHWYEQIDGTITYLEIRFDVGAPVNGPAVFMSRTDLFKLLNERATVPNAALMVTSPVTSADKYQANIVHRSKPQGAALHEAGTEVHQILEGSGTFVVGGTMTRPTGNGQGAQAAAAGGTITGGESRHVQPGDIVFIPANTPHWYKDLDGPISYLEVRFELPKK